ncbi:MAG TPA: hypothetical protein RMH99_10165 [Sandaracinaceae bacterium LLY-WYZ-13_1]|nr:hypothetical protein [Sandaracinaceae bacterium LLY-WYZ-13_1]
MDTVQRHANPYIPPRTERWPTKWKLGFGFIAALPPLLLGAALTSLLIGLAIPTGDLLPILFYVHVGTQFITLLLFGHLMISNPRLSDTARVIWGVVFLLMAPVGIPLYWWIHVVREAETTHPSATSELEETATVHVHVYDYRGGARHGDRARPDGTIIHTHAGLA